MVVSARVDVEAEVKTGVFKTTRRLMSFQVDASSGEVIGKIK